MTDYKLYYMPECHFCQKVLFFMDDEGIEVELANIHQGSNKEDLERIGGSGQVPALLIRPDQIMYESDEIIKYMKENLA